LKQNTGGHSLKQYSLLIICVSEVPTFCRDRNAYICVNIIILYFYTPGIKDPRKNELESGASPHSPGGVETKAPDRDAEGVKGVRSGEGYPPSQTIRGLESLDERRKLPQRGPGGTPAGENVMFEWC